MVTEKQALSEAIESLYETFSDYPLAQKIEGCPCFVSDEDEISLHRKPLRRLTAEDLTRYATKALTTWGTVSDYKHFLPRLFELVPELEGITYELDIEVLFGKLRYGKWEIWPEGEQKAIRQYLMALWRFVLSVPMDAEIIDEYLDGIGQAEDDMSSYLEAL